MKANSNFALPIAAALGLSAFVGIGQVSAADVIYAEPPAPAAPLEELPLASWTGPYAGIHLGYGFNGETTEPGNDIETSGFLGGAFLGYNYQVGRLVPGIEGDIGYSWMDGTNAGTTSESGVEGSLRARLGYAVTDDILLYGTAGGAAKNLEIRDAAGDDSNTMVGWTAGAGTDIKLTEQVFGRAEYRYTDFGSEDFDTGAGAREVSDKDHRVVFGIGVKF